MKGGKEGRREGGKEGRREGGKEGRREGGKEGRREGGRAELGGMEGVLYSLVITVGNLLHTTTSLDHDTLGWSERL